MPHRETDGGVESMLHPAPGRRILRLEGRAFERTEARVHRAWGAASLIRGAESSRPAAPRCRLEIQRRRGRHAPLRERHARRGAGGAERARQTTSGDDSWRGSRTCSPLAIGTGSWNPSCLRRSTRLGSARTPPMLASCAMFCITTTSTMGSLPFHFRKRFISGGHRNYTVARFSCRRQRG